MRLTHLQHWLTTPTQRSRDRRVIVWFGLSLAIAATYALMALQDAFSDPYVVQDDARQFVFWMQRFFNPDLFPNDLIAEYFQSVSPVGYVALYRTAAFIGIDPLIFNKLLPLVISLVTAGFFFNLSMMILPVPFTGFAASLLLTQTLWMKDDIVSGSPRSFLYPFFIAFLYFLTQFLRLKDGNGNSSPAPRHRFKILIFGLIALTLLGMFYPQYLLVGAGVLLFSLLFTVFGQRGAPTQKALTPQEYWFYGLHVGAIALMLLYYALRSSGFEPVITAAQARTMAEFWPGGRSFFFSDNPWWFYLVGDRSGIFHVGLLRPATLCLGLFLPWLMRSPHRYPLVRAITPRIVLLVQILIAAFGMWICAHLLLFRLHLPSRYLDHSWRFVMAIAAAMTLTLVLDTVLRWTNQEATLSSTVDSATNSITKKKGKGHPLMAWGVTGFTMALLLLYPLFVEDFPLTKYKQGHTPNLYAFLAETPSDTLVASVVDEVNNIPTFAQRSIFIGREYAIPYHLGYYKQFRERAIALIQAQYTSDLAELQDFIRRYGITYWILDKKAYEPDYAADIWIRQYLDEVSETMDAFKQGEAPALASIPNRCLALKEARLKVIDTACILKIKKKK